MRHSLPPAKHTHNRCPNLSLIQPPKIYPLRINIETSSPWHFFITLNLGVEHLLTESGVLAEGSLNGFLKGKFYNRSTRIHQLLATALEKALFIKYLEHNNDDRLLASSIMDQGDLSQEHTEQLVEDVRVINLMNRYETYLHSVMKGEYGHTAAYWATYVYFINRVYCELQRTVRTNDIEGYINVLPSVINICFSIVSCSLGFVIFK